MFVILATLDVILVILLVIVNGISFGSSYFSQYELTRRAKNGDGEAIKNLRLENSLVHLLSVKKLIVGLLVVLITTVSIIDFGWLIGVLAAAIAVLFYNRLAKLSFVKKISKKLYKKIERPILNLIDTKPLIFKVFSGNLDLKPNNNIHIGSREEFQHIVLRSEQVIAPEHRKLIVNGLMFDTISVKDIMTQRLKVRVVERNELLGPLVLNDLHKSGHSKVPVVRGNFDNVEGVLSLESIFEINAEKTKAVRDVMSKKVVYIEQGQTLNEALELMLQSGMNLLIVADEHQNNVGIITMSDLMDYLFGRS